MLMHLCKCGKRIPHGIVRCKACEDKHVAKRKESNINYNRFKRNKETDAFYKTQGWRNTREYILIKYNYIDLYDYEINNKITKANTVHHIIELEEDSTLALEESNLIPLSSRNHSRIHGKYVKDKEKTQELLRNILKNFKL